MKLAMWRGILMKAYDQMILNALLDKYERSSVFYETNSRQVSIDYKFTKQNLPAYYDESSSIYDEIHLMMKELEHKKLITIVWKDQLHHNVIRKVVLNQQAIDDAYAYVHRVRQQDINERCRIFLKNYDFQTETGKRFGLYLIHQIEHNLSVKKYVDIEDLSSLKELLCGLEGVLNNTMECYVRELSISLFGDSKKLEAMAAKITRILIDFDQRSEELCNCTDLFEEFNILKNPSYVFLKGTGTIFLKNSKIVLADFPHGVGVNSQDIDSISFELTGVTTVITIENLTTFHRYEKENTLILYLAGFHNEARRKMLLKIAESAGNISFLHWGDIDAGGFKIYRDLCKKTNLPFVPYRMNKTILLQYQSYAKKLTVNDVKEIQRLLTDDFFEEHSDVLTCMLEYGIKLEQEIIRE